MPSTQQGDGHIPPSKRPNTGGYGHIPLHEASTQGGYGHTPPPRGFNTSGIWPYTPTKRLQRKGEMAICPPARGFNTKGDMDISPLQEASEQGGYGHLPAPGALREASTRGGYGHPSSSCGHIGHMAIYPIQARLQYPCLSGFACFLGLPFSLCPPCRCAAPPAARRRR